MKIEFNYLLCDLSKDLITHFRTIYIRGIVESIDISLNCNIGDQVNSSNIFPDTIVSPWNPFRNYSNKIIAEVRHR